MSDDFGDWEALQKMVEQYGLVTFEKDMLTNEYWCMVDAGDEMYATDRFPDFRTAFFQLRLDLNM